MCTGQIGRGGGRSYISATWGSLAAAPGSPRMSFIGTARVGAVRTAIPSRPAPSTVHGRERSRVSFAGGWQGVRSVDVLS